MRKLPEVKQAKALMTEAKDWSVFRWLLEKSKVREVADQANAALDELDEEVKAGWNEELRAAYEALQSNSGGRKKQRRQKNKVALPVVISTEAKLFAEKVKAADDEAYQARMDAEDTFDEADRQLNTSLAREGCDKAVHSWALHEKAICLAETGKSSVETAG